MYLIFALITIFLFSSCGTLIRTDSSREIASEKDRFIIERGAETLEIFNGDLERALENKYSLFKSVRNLSHVEKNFLNRKFFYIIEFDAVLSLIDNKVHRFKCKTNKKGGETQIIIHNCSSGTYKGKVDEHLYLFYESDLNLKVGSFITTEEAKKREAQAAEEKRKQEEARKREEARKQEEARRREEQAKAAERRKKERDRSNQEEKGHAVKKSSPHGENKKQKQPPKPAQKKPQQPEQKQAQKPVQNPELSEPRERMTETKPAYIDVVKEGSFMVERGMTSKDKTRVKIGYVEFAKAFAQKYSPIIGIENMSHEKGTWLSRNYYLVNFTINLGKKGKHQFKCEVADTDMKTRFGLIINRCTSETWDEGRSVAKKLVLYYGRDLGITAIHPVGRPWEEDYEFAKIDKRGGVLIERGGTDTFVRLEDDVLKLAIVKRVPVFKKVDKLVYNAYLEKDPIISAIDRLTGASRVLHSIEFEATLSNGKNHWFKCILKSGKEDMFTIEKCSSGTYNGSEVDDAVYLSYSVDMGMSNVYGPDGMLKPHYYYKDFFNALISENYYIKIDYKKMTRVLRSENINYTYIRDMFFDLEHGSSYTGKLYFIGRTTHDRRERNYFCMIESFRNLIKLISCDRTRTYPHIDILQDVDYKNKIGIERMYFVKDDSEIDYFDNPNDKP